MAAARLGRSAALPVALVLAGTLTLEVAYGAPVDDALLFVLYEGAYVVLPGCLAYRALSARRGGALRQLAIGWALGYVLEVLTFMVTAATGTRPLFAAYPLVAVVAAWALSRVRSRPAAAIEGGEHLSFRFTWLIAGVCLTAAAYLGLAYFAGSPLPGRQSVSYFLDDPRWISLAADAKNHWPIKEPSISGEPLPYHYFVNVHLAGASQVTGIGLPVIYFRLYILPMVVLLVAEFVVLGAALARSARVGLGAAALAIFVGQLRLDTRHSLLSHTPFLGFFFTYLFRSPSFLFGLVICLPLLTLLGERVAARGVGVGRGEWVLVALLMIGASDAKVAILPVVFLALLLYGAIIWLRDRRTSLPTWLAAGLALVVMGTLYLGQYRGHPSELGVHPFAVFGTMPAVVLLKSYVSGGLPAFSGKGLLLSASGVVFGLVGMLAPQLVGLVWALRRGWGRLAPRQIWLLAVLLAGLGLGLALNEPGTVNQLYFLFYGVAAGCVLSAEGLGLAWRSRPAGVAARRLVVFALGWLAVLAAVMEVPLRLTWFHGRQTEAQRYALWYAALFLSVALLYVIARRRLGPTRWPAASLACAAVLTVGFLDAPGDYLAPAVARKGDVVVDPLFKPLSVELYRSLAWVRDHTPSSAVLAVNNQWLGRARTAPYEFNYSAFSERRVFLEGWAYSQGVRDRGFLTASVNPFPERLRLNRAAFLGDRSALTVLKKKFGVRYLLVDPGGGDRVDTRSLMRATRIVHPARVPVFELP